MINNEEFAKRLEKVIEFYGETASSFSEKIGVQRSSISHILSGRNKPSLDFVLKVLSEYPEVELYWLLNGKGTFPSHAPTSNAYKSEQQKIERSDSNVERTLENLPKDGKSIERIVIFYKDGTFQYFENLK